MTVDLVMRVSRDDRDRLIGTVGLARGADACTFSGTLELMRALEELVPGDTDGTPDPAVGGAHGGGNRLV